MGAYKAVSHACALVGYQPLCHTTYFVSRNYCLLDPQTYFCVIVGVIVCNSARNNSPKHFGRATPKCVILRFKVLMEKHNYAQGKIIPEIFVSNAGVILRTFIGNSPTPPPPKKKCV